MLWRIIGHQAQASQFVKYICYISNGRINGIHFQWLNGHATNLHGGGRQIFKNTNFITDICSMCDAPAANAAANAAADDSTEDADRAYYSCLIHEPNVRSVCKWVYEGACVGRRPFRNLIPYISLRILVTPPSPWNRFILCVQTNSMEIIITNATFTSLFPMRSARLLLSAKYCVHTTREKMAKKKTTTKKQQQAKMPNGPADMKQKREDVKRRVEPRVP